MKAVILAAGKGTRMKEITKEIPKPMALIHGKPMLEHIITYIKSAGVTEFGIVVGYKSSIVQNHFGDGSSLGVSITYIEQVDQNGTGAAVGLAEEFAGGSPFFFSFGDVMTPQENYPNMLNFYKSSGCHTLLGLNEVDDPYKGAAVYLDEDSNIVKMIEKPPKGTSTSNLNNAGIMILSGDVFKYTSNLELSPRGEYELTDVFGMLRDDGKSLKGHPLSGYWKDVGTPEDLEEAQTLIDADE